MRSGTIQPRANAAEGRSLDTKVVWSTATTKLDELTAVRKFRG
jgi:hypothetical protein